MKNLLKRLSVITLCILMILSLCCCRNTPDGNSSYSSESSPIINIDDGVESENNDSSEDTTSDDQTVADNSSGVTTSDDSGNDATSSNGSVVGEVTTSDPSTVASGNDGSGGTTVIAPTDDKKPTTSITTNTENGHTITATYEWHPGLPDIDVSYPLTVLVDNAPVNASEISLTSSTSGIKINGNIVTIPYSVRSQGKTVTVTAKHSSGVKCDINIPCYKYTQTFNDDFNGTELDRTKWAAHANYTTKAPADVSTYTVKDRAKGTADSYEVKDGKLNLLIKDQPCYDTANKVKYLYSECCLDTRGNFMQTYGLFQANMACCQYSGINSAFWMLPNGSYSTQYTNFKADEPEWGLAEIDIIEASVAFGNKDRKTFSVCEHFYDYTDNYAHTSSGKYYKVNDTITNFHTYSCVWTPDALYYYVDDELIRSTTGLTDKSAGGKSVSRAYMIVSISLYEDGGWVGKRDFDMSILPVGSQVDWVRAYKYN